MKIKVNPLPDHFFVSDAKVDCIGQFVKGENGEEIGSVIAYEIIEGRLILEIEVIDGLNIIGNGNHPYMSIEE